MALPVDDAVGPIVRNEKVVFRSPNPGEEKLSEFIDKFCKLTGAEFVGFEEKRTKKTYTLDEIVKSENDELAVLNQTDEQFVKLQNLIDSMLKEKT